MRVIGIVLVSVLVIGCKGSDPGSKSGSGPASETSKKPADPPPAKPKAPVLAEADVKALVDAWLAAQNKGDFEAYKGLYAGKMTGVKRVGLRTTRFDRDGWLSDRGRMFKKPMTVEAADVSVIPAGITAVVQLTQTFQQGAFKDAGPKQLVVVREKDGLRIAREEMLRSDVEPPAAGPTRYLMVNGDILLAAEADPGWRKGPLTLEEGDHFGRKVIAAVDEAALPPEMLAFKGKSFTSYDEKGAACQGAIDGYRIVVGVTPHFGTEQEWRDANTPEAEIAESVWGMTTPILLGTLKGCGGLVAVPGEGKAVVFDAVADGATEAGSSPLLAFRALPEWKKIQADFVDQGGKGKGEWDAQPDDGRTVTAMFGHPTSKKIFAVVNARAGRGCGDFEGAAGAIFEKVGSAWKKRSAGEDLVFQPLLVLDLDGDGSPEFVGERIIVGATPDGLAVTESFDWAFHDCDC